MAWSCKSFSSHLKLPAGSAYHLMVTAGVLRGVKEAKT